MSGVPSQPFKSETSARITTIPTRLDARRGERIIRWDDILQCYGDTTRFVMNGQNVVLFLTDDDLKNLIPFRIAYHPDVVLVVVTEDHLREESRPTNVASLSEGGSNESSSNPSSSHQVQQMRSVMDGSPLIDTSNHPHVVHPQDHDSQTPQTPFTGEQRHRQLPEIDPIRMMQEEMRQLRQEMQQQKEVQQLIHDQYQEAQQGMQQQIAEVVQMSQQADAQNPTGETKTLPQVVEQVEKTLQGIQDTNETVLDWLQRLQVKVDGMQRRIDETPLKLQLDVAQQKLGEADQRIEGSLKQLQLKVDDSQQKTSRLEQELQEMRRPKTQDEIFQNDIRALAVGFGFSQLNRNGSS
ncbi:hypothetical protein B0O80DRAFT_457511 [Mortierella sp. GBAus27b]|nr:hypothetical protein BGX31_006381 [Mortierella sp. GBA43]KAI8350797.1 hypothetical protein B0O80DRAFT_457511 [Mortierella sp. GBAus27b]